MRRLSDAELARWRNLPVVYLGGLTDALVAMATELQERRAAQGDACPSHDADCLELGRALVARDAMICGAEKGEALSIIDQAGAVFRFDRARREANCSAPRWHPGVPLAETLPSLNAKPAALGLPASPLPHAEHA